MRQRLLSTSLITAVAVTLAVHPAAADAPQVLVSIKPLHSLVAGVMDGVGTPQVLVEGAGSPHAYSLRPSDARRLDGADVVFWLGPDLETFLQRPLEALASDAEVVALGGTQGMTLLPTRAGGIWEQHTHDDAAHDHPGEEHAGEHHEEAHAHEHEAERHDEHHTGQADDHHAVDMHVWLDPHNAEVMAQRVAAVLSEIDPDHASTYAKNAVRLREQLEDLDRALQEKLAPVKDRPFLVFHDGYQYFERRFGLAAAGSITVDPERRPGARRLGEIHHRLAELDIACVFAEPQFEPALVETVVGGTEVRTGILDPLGAALDAGPQLYFELLEELAASLTDCLGAGQSG